MYRNTYLEIREDRYLENIEYLKKVSHKELIAVLKANGYGVIDHCAARLVEKAGVKLIAVSSLSEAMHLRNHGIQSEILILTYVGPEYIPLLKEHNLSLVSVSFDYLRSIQKDLNGLKIHIKLDTGMNRIGIEAHEASDVLHFLLENKADVKGIMTHFAMSDEADNKTTTQQYELFEKVVKELDYPFEYIHTSNTDASIHFIDNISTHIRSGIGLLGYSSYPSELKPCMSLKSEIINIKKVEAGQGVGYGHRYISSGEGWIATIPIGYADGFSKKNVGRFVYIDGEYCEIIGSVCMDQMMVLCKDYHPCGSTVELIGDHIQLEDVAKELGVITYEILVGFSDRITRVFKNKDGDITKKYNARFSKD